MDSDRVMVFESTTLNGKNGVQLNALSEVLQTYKGQVYLRRLRCDRDDFFNAILSGTITTLLGRPYEKDIIELMGAAAEVIHIFDGHKSDLTSVFCSELVTEIFKLWGFLPQTIPSNEYSPDDYNFKGRVDDQLRFSNEPVCLSNLVKIK
ncbi:MAG: hypothetical protein PHH26_00620 [Candidatus Thermoplasmatota archaeon]|nr:hypothetical protein [Candidatus Thermoplasmatota archaeon]